LLLDGTTECAPIGPVSHFSRFYHRFSIALSLNKIMEMMLMMLMNFWLRSVAKEQTIR